MEAYAKTLHLVSWAEANICFLRAMQLTDRNSNEAQRLLTSAVAFLETALNKATTNYRIMFLLASSLYHLSVISHTQSLDVTDQAQTMTEDDESGTDEASNNELRPMPRPTTTTTTTSNKASMSPRGTKTPTKATVVVQGTAQESNDSIAGVESLKFLSKASSTLDRLMQIYSGDQGDAFVGQVHNLWGHILAELGTQYHHIDGKSKQHGKWFRRALAEYTKGYTCVRAAQELRATLIRNAVEELNTANRCSAALALHNLRKVHIQVKACLDSVRQNDFELLLVAGEVEVALAKRVGTPVKVINYLRD
jgi:hypothetical protein